MAGMRVDCGSAFENTWTQKHRLNFENGLRLTALLDKAYDLGLITVLPDFTVRVSRHLMGADTDVFSTKALTSPDGRHIQLPERFKSDPSFLAAYASRFGFV
jgi:predicted restriction endonuclease